MRHYQNPHDLPLFRGRELLRLGTMIIMLGVFGMLILRARDPRTWQWLAAIDERVSPATLKAFDKANGRRPARYAGPRSFDGPVILALAPAARAAEETGAEQDPPSAGSADQQPAAAKPATPADDVPPPDPAFIPEKTASQPAPGPGASQPNPAAGVGPSPEALTADIPPPQPATDPDYLRKITESNHTSQSMSAGGGSENAGSASTGGSPSTRVPSSGESMSQPYDPAKDDVDPKKVAEFNAETAKEMLAVDEDPVERKDFEYECQALDDRDVLRPEEMAAYWRLVRWVQEQPYKDMNARAKPGLTFGHFFANPARYRGQLVRLKVRVSRATAHDTEENGNGLGVERVFDLWGCTDESSPNPYALAVTDLPADFPLGHGIQEDVTFVGYFLKLVAYKARDDKTRAAPLLIGRVIWHPVVLPVSPVNTNYVWLGLLGLLIGVMLLVRFTFQLQPMRRPSRLPPLTEGEEVVPIETWLERAEGEPAENEKTPEAIIDHPNGDKKSNGAGHVFPQRLDHSEDQER